jgi:hypothetical protein
MEMKEMDVCIIHCPGEVLNKEAAYFTSKKCTRLA